MTYVVNVINQGQSWYLRGTTWTGEAERASRFASEQAARAGLLKAKPFMKASLFKLATVQPVEPSSDNQRFASSQHQATVQAMLDIAQLKPIV